jgi:DNA-directed RNA polymerase subunit RPC12/RpoP
MEMLILLPILYILLMIFMFGLVATVIGFWIWMIVDCMNNEPPGNDKIAWLLVVILLNWIGALVYFSTRRSARRKGLPLPAILPPPVKSEPIRVQVKDIVFSCVSCGQSLTVDARGAGMSVDCPKCGKPVYVPSR